MSRARTLLAAGATLGTAVAWGCAQPSAPPGGPPDPMPPVLVSISPDSGTTGGRPDEVVFRFDEVVNERPTGVSSLEELVLISPRESAPRVRWRRDALTVRPARGFRDSTVYVVTLLPGVTDLRGNARDSGAVTVFSTGGPIPDTRLTGVVFDWVAERGVPNALVQAITRPDSVVHVTRADSTGRFTMPFVPVGSFTVIGAVDENRNFAVDARELWDSTAVTLTDSAHVELYAFVHDTVGPAVRDVAIRDSVTLRLELDRPLAVDQEIDTTLVGLFAPDSTPVPIVSVVAGFPTDTAAAPADSAAAPADTAAAPTLPPLARPPAVPADTADTTGRVPRPVPSRPAPVSRLQVRTAVPLTPGARYRLELRDARNLLGYARTSERSFQVPARDTTTRDTSAVDSAAVDSVPPAVPPAEPPGLAADRGAPPASEAGLAPIGAAMVAGTAGPHHRRRRAGR